MKLRRILSGLVLFVPAALAASDNGRWKTATPIIYKIDYGDGHVGNPDYLKKIGEAPPQLLHVGEDVPFSRVYGTKDGYGGNRAKDLTPEEVRAKISELKACVTSLHSAGVEWVIPYINNKTVIGDPVKRDGYWAFFDHWDQSAEFGFGPRPKEDLILARMHYPFQPPRG